MTEIKIKRALISVYDKTGIVDFARALVDEFGIEIISTGGTASLLKENKIPVTLVEEVTGFPEMLDGRVKTLHPKIHAGILADRDNPEHMKQLEEQGIKPIDMVVVNLYPFEKTVADPTCTFEQAIEMIDIGGPCMLRAAAKNHKHVLVVYDSEAYSETLKAFTQSKDDGEVLPELRLRYAAGTFEVTTCYDGDIAKWINSTEQLSHWGVGFDYIPLADWGELRYGENQHQPASLYQLIEDDEFNREECDLIIADAGSDVDEQSRMSLNNYNDGHAALELCKELSRAFHHKNHKSCVFIKHTNACGVGIDNDPIVAYKQAYLGDYNAAMGGILVCDFDITSDFAKTVMETYGTIGKTAGAGGFFVEVWIATNFEDKAVEVIRSTKKWGQRVRLLYVDDMDKEPDKELLEYKSITGGMLAQSRDLVGLNEDQWKVVTKRQPTDREMQDLRLAWLVCKHTKSNAITVCKDNMLIGNGAGQMSRVMSCRIATWLAKENGHEDKLKGSVAASDAFFPFPDGPGILIDAGVTAIIQPGGSKRDDDTIAACNERDVAMICTGTRHFKH